MLLLPRDRGSRFEKSANHVSARSDDRPRDHRAREQAAGRFKIARLRQSAVVEDINPKVPRSLDKALFAKLVAGDWITRHQNLAIIGLARLPPTQECVNFFKNAGNAST
jgi:hypothetical protein